MTDRINNNYQNHIQSNLPLEGTEQTSQSDNSVIIPKAAGETAPIVPTRVQLQTPAPTALDVLKSQSADALLAMLDVSMRDTDRHNGLISLRALAEGRKASRQNQVLDLQKFLTKGDSNGLNFIDMIRRDKLISQIQKLTHLYNSLSNKDGLLGHIVARDLQEAMGKLGNLYMKSLYNTGQITGKQWFAYNFMQSNSFMNAQACGLCMAIGVATQNPLLIAAGVVGASLDNHNVERAVYQDAYKQNRAIGMSPFLSHIMAKHKAQRAADMVGNLASFAVALAGGHKNLGGIKLMLALDPRRGVACRVLDVLDAAMNKGRTQSFLENPGDLNALKADRKRAEAMISNMLLTQLITAEQLKEVHDKLEQANDGVKEAVGALNQQGAPVMTAGADAPA